MSIVVAIHILVCVTLVIVVLLQQGKGADIGAVFGGATTTNFGSNTGGNFMTKLTWACAIIFFSTSIFLAYSSTRRVSGSIFEGHLPPQSQSAPARSNAPVLPSSAPALPAAVPPAAHSAVPAPAPQR